MPGKKRRAPPRKTASEKQELIERLAKALGVSPEEAELRALRNLARALDVPSGAAQQPVREAPPAARGPLPQRLFLLLDGRGLDGRGLPIEIIDLPAIVGSGRNCTVWVNSPRIETRHVQITRDGDGWVLEDLATEAGTFVGDRRIERRVLRDGDEFRLAGYLRVRAELR